MSLERARLLLQQSRPEMAEEELRKLLGTEPNNADAYSLLALTLDELERTPEAIDAAQSAVGLEPDDSFAHYVLGVIYASDKKYKKAEAAAHESQRLMPLNPAVYGLMSQVYYAQSKWEDSLQAARSGLAFDPEDSTCANFEAMALVKLGRREESATSLDGALYHDPNNPFTHATSGWVALESGDREKAMTHFREALRIDPSSEYARSGIVEALKARNIVYRWMLGYFFWMSRLGQRTRMFVIFGALFGVRILRNLAESVPALAPFVTPILILYGLFVYLSWTADALFNVLLRFDSFGRLALSEEETRTSNYVGALLGLAALFLIGWAITRNGGMIFAAFGALLMVIPVAATFGRESGRGKNILLVYTAVLSVIGLIGLMLGVSGIAGAGLFAGLFVLGVIAFMWIATFVK